MDATDSAVIDPPVDPEPLRRIRPTFHLKSLTIVIAMIAIVFSFSLPEVEIHVILWGVSRGVS
jgi:hypothetical protein